MVGSAPESSLVAACCWSFRRLKVSVVLPESVGTTCARQDQERKWAPLVSFLSEMFGNTNTPPDGARRCEPWQDHGLVAEVVYGGKTENVCCNLLEARRHPVELDNAACCSEREHMYEVVLERYLFDRSRTAMTLTCCSLSAGNCQEGDDQ